MVNPINKEEKFKYSFLFYFPLCFKHCALSFLLFFNYSVLMLAVLERELSDSPPALPFIVAPLSSFFGLVSFLLCAFYSYLILFPTLSLRTPIFCLSLLCFMEQGEVG